MSKRKFYETRDSFLLHWTDATLPTDDVFELDPKELEEYREKLCGVCLIKDPNYVDVEVRLDWGWAGREHVTVTSDENTYCNPREAGSGVLFSLNHE